MTGPRLTIEGTAPTTPVHLWVLGVVVDAATTVSGRYVVPGRPGPVVAVEAPVAPIAGCAVAGALVVAWDGPGPGAAVRHAAAVAVDEVVQERVWLADLARPTPGNLRDLCLGIDQDVHDTLTTGWFAARRAGDGHVATVSCVLTLDGPVDQPLDLRFRRRSVDHDLRAMLRYSVAVR